MKRTTKEKIIFFKKIFKELDQFRMENKEDYTLRMDLDSILNQIDRISEKFEKELKQP